jgi:hypothetical protein
LDGRGEASIYLDIGVEYKFVVEDSKGALLLTQEPVYGAVWPNAEDWPSNASLAYQYMLEAKAAAGAIGPIKFYDTYAQALADISNLHEDDLIEISRDETRNGARTRYRVKSGSLVFVVNLNLGLDEAFQRGYQKKILLSLPLKHPEWDWVFSTYGIRSYPQSFVVDEDAGKLLVIDGSTPRVIQVYNWPSGTWDRVFLAPGGIVTEGAVIRKEGGKKLLYMRHVNDVMAKYDLTQYPDNRTTLNPVEITTISCGLNFSEFNGRWVIGNVKTSANTGERSRGHFYEIDAQGKYYPYDIQDPFMGIYDGREGAGVLTKTQGICITGSHLVSCMGGQQKLDAAPSLYGFNGVRVFDRSGKMVSEALCDPFKMAEILRRKGQNPSLIEAEGINYLRDGSVVSLTITQDWNNPNFANEGMLFMQEFAISDYIDFSSAAVTSPSSMPTELINGIFPDGSTGPCDPATGEKIDSVLKSIKYMAKYGISELLAYSTRTPMVDINGGSIASGTLIRFRMAHSGLFYFELQTFNRYEAYRVYLSGSTWIQERSQSSVFANTYSVDPVNPGDITFRRVSNTSISINVRCTDGVIRSAVLALS